MTANQAVNPSGGSGKYCRQQSSTWDKSTYEKLRKSNLVLCRGDDEVDEKSPPVVPRIPASRAQSTWSPKWWYKTIGLAILLNVAAAGHAICEDALSEQFPKLARLATALQSFRYPENGRENITVWRQSTFQTGSFSVTIEDERISLKGAIESFKDGCQPMDLKNVAALSDAGIGFVDYTDPKHPPANRTLTSGHLVILLAPTEGGNDGLGAQRAK